VPAHPQMRGFDRDLIRGGHYGQRSCEPRKQAEHMAAPTNAANVKKVLANPEPSTHGTQEAYSSAGKGSAYWGSAEACVRSATIGTWKTSGSTSNSLGTFPHNRLVIQINPRILLLRHVHRSDTLLHGSPGGRSERHLVWSGEADILRPAEFEHAI
jgi:hypothetical protein